MRVSGGTCSCSLPVAGAQEIGLAHEGICSSYGVNEGTVQPGGRTLGLD